ncbi:hypothetical protein ES703_51694 [subsurface metagenome]
MADNDFSSFDILFTSSDAACSVCTPPHDFQEVACLRLGVLYIRTGWTLNFFPVTKSGLLGFHSSIFLLAKAEVPRPRTPPAILAVVNPTNSLLFIHLQHIVTS